MQTGEIVGFQGMRGGDVMKIVWAVARRACSRGGNKDFGENGVLDIVFLIVYIICFV